MEAFGTASRRITQAAAAAAAAALIAKDRRGSWRYGAERGTFKLSREGEPKATAK